MLSNKNDLYETMNIEDFGTVEIKEFMSSSFSVVRTWLAPILLKALSLNKHNDYPQNIFEEGICVSRKGEDIHEFERISACLCDSDVDFTKAKQILEIKRLLVHTNLSVTEIAVRLNFPDQSYFAKFFKRETGVSPLQYRVKSLD